MTHMTYHLKDGKTVEMQREDGPSGSRVRYYLDGVEVDRTAAIKALGRSL